MGQASDAESALIASFEAKVKEKEAKKLERLEAEKKREQEILKKNISKIIFLINFLFLHLLKGTGKKKTRV